MGLFDAIANVVGLGYQVSKDQRLTGAQREANAFTSQENLRAMQFSHDEAQAQMDFQERMANTQYQRGVADMEAAGINPALAYQNGGSAAPSGAAGAGSAGSSVDPGRGMSMSDMLSALRFKKELKLLDKQADNVEADTESKRASAEGQRIENSSKPAIIASQLKINENEAERISAATRDLIASAEGQEISNDWKPSLFANELENGRVSRAQGLAAIVRIQSELGVLDAQRRSYEADISLKASQKALNLAMKSLTELQSEGVSLDNWRKDFGNKFQEEFGTQPDEPIWNALVGVLGKAARGAGGSIDSFLRNVKEGGPSLFDGLDILGKKVIDGVSEKGQDIGSKLQYFKFKYLD